MLPTPILSDYEALIRELEDLLEADMIDNHRAKRAAEHFVRCWRQHRAVTIGSLTNQEADPHD